MIYLKRQIKKIYNNWGKDEYIFEKDNTDKFKSITYKDFIEKSLSIAKYLIDNKYKNKTIVLISENSIDLMACDLAIAFYVGKSTIICKEWNKVDIIDSINEINADLIMYSDRYKDIVNDISKDFKIDTLAIKDIPFKFTSDLLDLKVKKYNEISKIVFSSGTTGKSKGVLLTLENIFSGLESLQRRCHLNHEDIAYMFLPMHHTYASICHFMYSLITGHRIYIASSSTNIAKEILEVNPTVFCCVPVVIKRLYEFYKDNIDKAFGTRIRCIVSGGAPLEKEYREVFKNKNLCLLQTYALTECSSSFTLAYPYQDDLESAGEIYEDIDVKIVDKDKDGIGEIIVKGKNVFHGYTDENLNKIVFDKDGYFHTGDLGYIKNNKLYIKGRKKKMLLTSNGENISASKIEDRIKGMCSNIRDVKAYTKNDTIGVNIYVTDLDYDYDELINKYNSEVARFERVNFYKVYEDSIDTRLKQ